MIIEKTNNSDIDSFWILQFLSVPLCYWRNFIDGNGFQFVKQWLLQKYRSDWKWKRGRARRSDFHWNLNDIRKYLYDVSKSSRSRFWRNSRPLCNEREYSS